MNIENDVNTCDLNMSRLRKTIICTIVVDCIALRCYL
jgi:hypothetical protein